MNPSQPKDQKALIRTDIPGPKSSNLRQLEDEALAPGLQGFALMAGIAVESASGSTVTDVDGNTFLDIIGGIGVNGLGHSHPKYVKAIQDQVGRASVGSFTTAARVELVGRLKETPPGKGIDRTQLYSSGAEAVESALRLAKCHTGKYEFVGFWGGFHGKTLGALSLMGSTFKDGLGPMASGSHSIPYADCYRCPLKTTYPGCGLACVEMGRKHLKTASAGAIAAFIIEPMQGTAGNVIPPDDFLPAVASLAKEFDALLIVDEMITGFGRTGKYWGVDHSGAQPDIVTLGKQFGGGYPMSAIMTSSDIANSKPWSNPSGSSSSYGGNPLASQAAATTLSIIDEERLVENSKEVGNYFLEQLQEKVAHLDCVGEVRGRGLFLSIELVSDRTTKTPLAKRHCEWIFKECLRHGLLTMAYSPSFRIQPALTIDRATVDNVVATLEKVVTSFQESKGHHSPKSATLTPERK